jgi:dihydroneopterin aldolase
MPDLILIEQLELSATLGVPDAERTAPQRLTANLRLEPLRDFRALADAIENTVDYAEVTTAIERLVAERPRKLLETFAEEIAAALLEQFALAAVEIELRKYILPQTAFVAVQIRRERRAPVS